MSEQSTLENLEVTSPSDIGVIEEQPGGTNPQSLWKPKESMNLRPNRDGTTVTLTAINAQGEGITVTCNLDEVVKCPACGRNQPAEYLGHHVTHKHRR